MHIQSLFAITAGHELQALIGRHPLATLVSACASGPAVELLPLEFAAGGPRGRLRGHVARHHPLATGTPQGTEMTAIFRGPDAYVSPRWYVNGQRSGRVAPSWNYVVVQARGRIRFVDSADWVVTHLAALTAQQEARRDRPWSLAEAPGSFVDEMAAQLIGFEIDLSELVGKRFLSQQRTEADRRSIVAHLQRESSGAARDLGALIAP
ncbi:FMN-binding negative transcriptional regulator [Variovorax sp. PAMC 28711]|uniref:FMN-binding negative transcriptional regulator n=1 Tax=Variovorax sp. PAMC 28711 TaxID=1795631 RepID=UPI00078EA0EF|nr:FMN-binding negative transcriptional regulator [Variovorax sp. PAMC 28711]AMM24127.1 negative transcriptional regulator [Variovorax sp. PAMC 28711]